MVGVVGHFTLDSAAAQAALAGLSEARLAHIAERVGTMMENQTKQRIDVEKAAPDGTPWAPWSPRYAESLKRPNRRLAASLLVSTQGLLDSIENLTTGDEIMVGSNLVYAAIHQFGGDTSRGHPPIPARPYLGISAANGVEIEQLVIGLAEGALQ